MHEFVWYASYGSNINRDRFYKYLTGGKVEGSRKIEIGARDKTLPLKEDRIVINHRLFFAENSKRWNGGVAFIEPNFKNNEKTLCKMYLIKLEQFKDIFCQENVLDLESLDINLFYNIKKDKNIILSNTKYGRVLFLGECESCPILTFTTIKEMDEVIFNKPSNEYLQLIIKGIVENFNLDENEAYKYLLERIEG